MVDLFVVDEVVFEDVDDVGGVVKYDGVYDGCVC